MWIWIFWGFVKNYSIWYVYSINNRSAWDCSSIVVVVVVTALLLTAGQTMGGLHLDCLGETDGYYQSPTRRWKKLWGKGPCCHHKMDSSVGDMFMDVWTGVQRMFHHPSGNVRGTFLKPKSSKSQNLILWGEWICLVNFMAIFPIQCEKSSMDILARWWCQRKTYEAKCIKLCVYIGVEICVHTKQETCIQSFCQIL